MRYIAILLIFSTFSLFAQQKGVTPITGNSPSATGETYAVVVGISDYQNDDIPDLRFAHKDAAAFAEYLKSPAGGNLNDEQLKMLLNENATTAQIAAALEWLVEVCEEGDRAIIYFSGHGDVETKTMFQLGYLLTWDSPARTYVAGAFPLQYLQAVVSTLSVQNKVEVALITDACRAGKLAGNTVGGAQITNSNLSKQFANEVKILSCQPDEFSLEGEQWGGGRGVFSYHLVDGLYGLADNNADGQVNLYEIGRYLEDKVSTEADPHSQFPMTSGSRTSLMAKVDADALAFLKEQRSKETPVLAAIDSKGFEEGILEDIDSVWQQKYQQFVAAVDEGRLLDSPTEEPAAYDLYLELQEAIELKKLHGTMQRNLAAALQDDAQQAINAYLAANPSELQKRYDGEEDYARYPSYLRKAAEILGEKNFYYPYLMAKLHYFEGLQIRLDSEKDSGIGGFQKAIDLQLRALEFQPDAPYVLNELGVLHTRLKKDEKAFGYYIKAIELAPEWGLPYANYSVGLHYAGEQEKAIEYGEKALKLMSDFPNIYNYMAWLYTDSYSYLDKSKWSRKGVELQDNFHFESDYLSSQTQRRNRYEKSIKLLENIIEKEPDYITAYTNLARVYFETHQPEKVKPLMLEALSRDSNNVRIYKYLLYHSYYGISTSKEKTAYYINKLETKFPEIYRNKNTIDGNRGIILYNQGKKELAIEYFNKALVYDNWSDWINGWLHYIYSVENDLKKAEKYTLKALIGNNSLRNKLKTANYMVSLNRSEDAEYLFKKAIEIKPDYLDAYVELAFLYQQKRKYKKAAEVFDKMAEMAPDDPVIYTSLARAQYMSKEFDKAHENIAKSTEVDTMSIEGCNFGSWFYWMHGDYEKAEKYALLTFDRTDAYDYNNKIDQYWHLAWIYFETGRLAEALATLEEARAAIPRDVRFYEGMLYFNVFSGNVEACEKITEKYSNKLPEAAAVTETLRLIKNKEFEKALTVLNQSFETTSNFGDINRKYLMVQINAQLGHTEKAMEWLDALPHTHFSYRFIDSDPLLNPLKKLPAYHQLMQYHFPEKYEELFPYEPEVPVYYADNCVLMGHYYLNEENEEKAAFYFNKAAEITADTLSDFGASLLALGLITLDQFEKAKKIMRPAFNFEIQSDLFNAANLNYIFNGKETAIPYFEKYITAAKIDAPNNAVGVFFKKNGEFELSEKYLKNEIKKHPDKMFLRRNLSRLYFFFDKKKEAFQILEEAEKLAPEELNTASLTAVLHYFEEPTKAKSYFDQLSKEIANYDRIWNLLELMRNNEFEKADNYWSEIPDDLITYFWMEMVKYKYVQMKIREGKKEKAVELLEEILKKNWFINYQLFSTDPELDSIREMRSFKRLMRKYFPGKSNQ